MATDAAEVRLTPKDLLRFCRDGHKFDTSKPFVRDGFLWATNHVLMVRIPFDGPNTVPSPTDRPFPDVVRVWGQFMGDSEFTPLPDKTWNVIPCWACEKSGSCQCETCQEGGDYLCECPCCDGDKEVFFPRECKIGANRIDSKYDRMIRDLPGLVVYQRDDPNNLTGISFKFSGGGEGLLMPMEWDKPKKETNGD